MTRLSSKSGFTLLEVLVASLLLGMLVTILTMVFNSSSIAWRTGKSSIAKLSIVRRELSFSQRQADNLLPRVIANDGSKVGLVVGPWLRQKDGSAVLRTRAVQAPRGVNLDDLGFAVPDFKNYDSAQAQQSEARLWLKLDKLDSPDRAKAQAFTVGVLSYGPDGKKDTEDDISTWPDKVE